MSLQDRAACIAQRQQQMWRYQQEQQRAREEEQRQEADAEAARQRQEEDAQRARERTAQAAQDAAQRAQARLDALRAEREARAAAEREQFERVAAAEAERRRINDQWTAYNRQQIAEQTADNRCKDRDIARRLLRQWGDLPGPKSFHLEAVDIEHLTTTSHQDAAELSCHGVFVINDGSKIAGTFRYHENVAGDIIYDWTRDDDQDLSRFSGPPELPPAYLPAPPISTPATATRPLALSPPGPAAADVNVLPSQEQGLADRRRWELWMSGLVGEEQAGANWWAGHRSLPRHGTCEDDHLSVEPKWTLGCQEARDMLTPLDVRRRTDPAYRVGWNSY